MLLDAFGALTWIGAYGLGVGEATPEMEDVSSQGFFAGIGLAGALWLATGLLAVMRWKGRRSIWWIPFAWWTPTLILAISVWSAIQS
jgi:hypothetical protein